MKATKASSADLYYTTDHEWINFQGAIAYTGVCAFKLTGFRGIQQILFHLSSGFAKRGDVIATIVYNDYRIEAHMPVDGKIITVNQQLTSGSHLLDHPESYGWLAQISPASPYNREGLLLPVQYQLNGKSKYAK